MGCYVVVITRGAMINSFAALRDDYFKLTAFLLEYQLCEPGLFDWMCLQSWALK